MTRRGFETAGRRWETTESHGISAWSWNAMPMPPCRTVRSGGSPNTEMEPASAVSRPATKRSAVDLPHPEGPISATNSPSPTPRSKPSSAGQGLAPANTVVLGHVLQLDGAAIGSLCRRCVLISHDCPPSRAGMPDLDAGPPRSSVPFQQAVAHSPVGLRAGRECREARPWSVPHRAGGSVRAARRWLRAPHRTTATARYCGTCRAGPRADAACGGRQRHGSER